MFTIFDKSGTGTVDPIDFQHVCHDLGVPISETEAIAVYGSHDVRCVSISPCHVSVFVSVPFVYYVCFCANVCTTPHARGHTHTHALCIDAWNAERIFFFTLQVNGDGAMSFQEFLAGYMGEIAIGMEKAPESLTMSRNGSDDLGSSH